MKKYLLILNLFIAVYISAQPAPGSYVVNNNIDKFVGIWQWTSGTDTLRIVLSKQKIHYPLPYNYDEDMIVGWHKYVKNGVLIESSMQFMGTDYWNRKSTIFGSTRSQNNNQLLVQSFYDLTKNKRGLLKLTFLTNSTTQITWKLKDRQGIKSGGFQYNFSVPTDVILTKVNPPTGSLVNK